MDYTIMSGLEAASDSERRYCIVNGYESLPDCRMFCEVIICKNNFEDITIFRRIVCEVLVAPFHGNSSETLLPARVVGTFQRRAVSVGPVDLTLILYF